MQGVLLQMTIYLAAAVVAVPLCRRLGFGSVLGYLAAGVVIGPVLGLVGRETESVQAFAEFGVVLMLFLIGLELEPRLLWDDAAPAGRARRAAGGAEHRADRRRGPRRRPGLEPGGRGRDDPGLSSTAIVMQTLSEKKLTHTEGGRASFAVLLFQDVAALPLLAVMPLLALGAGAAPVEALHGESLLADLSPGGAGGARGRRGRRWSCSPGSTCRGPASASSPRRGCRKSRSPARCC